MSNTGTETKEQSGGLLKALLALLALAVIGLTSYMLRDFFDPEVIATAPVDEGCDLRQKACVSALPNGGEVHFAIEPRSIPLLKPLQLKIDIREARVSGVEIDFVGIGMNMGYNRPKLNQTDKNVFEGEAVLPVCVRRRMDWEARVLLHTRKGIIMAPFRFYTIR